jgi:AAA family ATP:ADP antiporter
VQPRKNPLERFLSLFAEVRVGEGPAALLLTLNIFLLMTSYYIVKPVREALILSSAGAEIKSYMSAGQAILLLVLIVPLYAKLSSRFSRRRLITLVTLFFAACLVAFYLLAQLEAPLGIIFFIWVGIFNLMVIAQFWSFANDLYSPAAGKRLFAIIAFGQSSGAVFGSFITGRLIEPLGVYQLMLLSALLLFMSLLLTYAVDARQGRAKGEGSGGRANGAVGMSEADKPLPVGGAFSLVMNNRYLLMIALLTLLLNWVNTTGEYILGRTVSAAATEAVGTGAGGGLDVSEYIGKFYADFYSVVNLAGMLLQLLLVSRILKYLGVRVALLILPVIALGGYALLAFYPLLAVIRWVKTAENATDYSLQNTVRHYLFLPTTREQKYKAKQAIDTFFWRAGDVLSAALVYAGTTWLGFNVGGFALVNLALVSVWLVLALIIAAQNRRLMTVRGAVNNQD